MVASDRHGVGEYVEACLWVGADVAVGIHRREIDGLADHVDGRTCGLLLEVVGSDLRQLVFLGVEVLRQACVLTRHRQEVGVFEDGLCNRHREFFDTHIQLVHIVIVGTHILFVLRQFALLLEQVVDLLALLLELIPGFLQVVVDGFLRYLECLETLVDLLEAVLAAGCRLDIYLTVGLEPDAGLVHVADSGEGSAVLYLIALDGDVGGLADYLGHLAYDVLVAVDTRVLGHLLDDGRLYADAPYIACALQPDISTPDDHLRLAARIEDAAEVDVANDDLWRREHDALVVADHPAHRLVEVVDFQVIDLILQFADGLEDAFLEIAFREFVDALIKLLIY